MRALLLAAAVATVGCVQTEDLIAVGTLCGPLEVDVITTPGLVCGTDTEQPYPERGLVAEEAAISFLYQRHPDFPDDNQPIVQVTGFRVEYQVNNAEGDSLPPYFSGAGVEIIADTAFANPYFYFRVASFDQLDAAREFVEANGQAMNVRANMTFDMVDHRGDKFTKEVGMDLIFGSFLRCSAGLQCIPNQ